MDEQTKVFDEITTEEEDTTIDAIEEETGGSIFSVLAVAAIAGGAALVGWAIKKRGKIDEYRIKRLEKKGYVVTKPEPVEEVETEEVLDEAE